MSVNLTVPTVYRRGLDILEGIGEFCAEKGSRVLLIGGKNALAAAQERITGSLLAAGVEVIGVEWYGGECTWANIEKVSQIAQQRNADIIVAAGGGKALDTGKAAAFKNKIPCVTVPTIAATCAAFTPLSIVYRADGVYLENTNDSVCPAGVFLDTSIIINAPSKWLYAGMGDTLAKFYELEATTSKIPITSWTLGGINNGKICYQIIKEFGPKAKETIERQETSDSLDSVLDAIVFYAGMSSILGGEKCRGAASHAIYFGFTNIPAAHALGHGSLVGFGNLCLLALRQVREEEMLPEIKLAKECGVPIKLAQLGELSNEDIGKVAEVAASAQDMKYMPMQVTADMVVKAIRLVDRLSSVNF